MNKTIIVSNRLPFKMKIEGDELTFSDSEGGLATGMRSIHEEGNSLWIGWPGIREEEILPQHINKLNDKLNKSKCAAVSLSKHDIELFYNGFSNNTIWPLFHYFSDYTVIKQEYWDSYLEVNKKFADIVLKNLNPGDKLWIHDYHLLLLPRMIKEKLPDVSIGFFLHIPFPSYELFRMLPWREEILNGMLGADLLGFHTFDYKRHFISAVKRLLAYDTKFNQVLLNGRAIHIETFPMGIDFNKFYNCSLKDDNKSLRDKSVFEKEIHKYLLPKTNVKLVLSIDRLDYTKGIARRLRAFVDFLIKYPQYREKVTLLMLTVPSRGNIEQYQLMKSEIDELVGSINAEYSTINWRPILYFYRSVPFDNLISLYRACDIALVTPVRDGMNLVAKEYIATRVDQKGVLILSEMAGASKEMAEALIVNPYNSIELADALKTALEMPEKEQIKRNEILQARLKKYDVVKWANDFMLSLTHSTAYNNDIVKTINLKGEERRLVINKFKKSSKRIIFLDYDGTLVSFNKNPKLASPDIDLYTLLDNLSNNPKNELVIISGRKKNDLDEWFADNSYCLVAEHGAWIKKYGEKWIRADKLSTHWKDAVLAIMNFYMDRTPGSHIENKDYSIVWHYRNVDPELGAQMANELRDELSAITMNNELEILEGSKIIEIKSANVNKGCAANSLLLDYNYDSIICIGDDLTDEYMFKNLTDKAVTIKVGRTNTEAMYTVNDFKEVREFLQDLS